MLVDCIAFGGGVSSRWRNQELQQRRWQELLFLVIAEFEFREQPQFEWQLDPKFEQHPQQELRDGQHSEFGLHKQREQELQFRRGQELQLGIDRQRQRPAGLQFGQELHRWVGTIIHVQPWKQRRIQDE